MVFEKGFEVVFGLRPFKRAKLHVLRPPFQDPHDF